MIIIAIPIFNILTGISIISLPLAGLGIVLAVSGLPYGDSRRLDG